MLSKDLIWDIIVENQRLVAAITFIQRECVLEEELNYVPVATKQ